ncbi:MAG: lipopolysaccharide heptosyltransferase II [Planctomycetota bacterium]|jgi:heptosyltransferase-2
MRPEHANPSAGPAAPLGADVHRLLVVCPSWVGDTVMATGALDALRRALPEARITGLLRPGLDELLDGGDWLDEVVVHANRGPLAPLRVALMLRRGRFDAALLLPNSFRSALTVRLAGIPRRIGYDRDGRGRLLTTAVPVAPSDVPVPAIESYSRLVAAAVGGAAPDAAPRLAVTDAQRAAADALLADVDRPLAVLNPGANRPDKRWPATSFARVADDLAARRGMAIAVTGAPAEAPVLAEVIAAAAPATPVIDLAARGVGLGSLKGVLDRAAVLVTNDTGPRHIAAALGTPVVSLFGPTDHRWTTLPAAREHVLVADPFLPEHVVADRVPRHCRIDRITVPDVVAAIDRLLGAAAGPAAAGR